MRPENLNCERQINGMDAKKLFRVYRATRHSYDDAGSWGEPRKIIGEYIVRDYGWKVNELIEFLNSCRERFFDYETGNYDWWFYEEINPVSVDDIERFECKY